MEAAEEDIVQIIVFWHDFWQNTGTVNRMFTAEEVPKRHGLLLQWIIGSALVCGALLSFFLTASVIFFGRLVLSHDVPPPNDAWLLPKPFPPANGLSSVLEFSRRTRKLLQVEKDERSKLPENVRKIATGHLQEARAFMDRHRVVLDEVNHYLASNKGPLLFPGGSEALTFGSDCSYLSDFQEGVNLAAMNARVLAQVGQGKEAVEQSLAIMRLGKQFTGVGCFLIQWLVAVTVQAIGVSALEDAANHHPCDEAEVAWLQKEISDLEIPLQSFKSPLQWEYLSSKRMVHQMQAANQASSFNLAHSEGWWKRTLKPNATCAMKLDQIKPLFLACDKDWRGCLLAGREDSKVYEEFKSHRVRMYLSTNLAGEI